MSSVKVGESKNKKAERIRAFIVTRGRTRLVYIILISFRYLFLAMLAVSVIYVSLLDFHSVGVRCVCVRLS